MKLYKDKNWLTEQYWNKKLSTYQMADIAGCSVPTLRDWMIKLGVPRRTRSEALKGREITWRDKISKGKKGKKITISEERRKQLVEQIRRISKLPSVRKKQSERMMGDKNPMWAGDNVGYDCLHGWVKRHKPKPEFCECCGVNPPYDLSNISGKYLRDVDDYEWLCRKCHMLIDGRLEKWCGTKQKLKNVWEAI